MFDGIKRMWRRITEMFGYTKIKNIIGKDVALSQTMIDAINEWKKMMNGEAEWLTDSIKSLRIEHGICREFADTVLVEMETSLSNDTLDEMYQKNLLLLNENLQFGLGLGSFCLRPLPGGNAEFITADKFIPVQFGDDGNPIDVAFLTVKKVGETDYYTKVERHYFTNGNLTIENKCYHSRIKVISGRAAKLMKLQNGRQSIRDRLFIPA